MTRREQYNSRYCPLIQHCITCQKIYKVSVERCNYHCIIGMRLRWLETEFSDVTGCSHRKWETNSAKK